MTNNRGPDRRLHRRLPVNSEFVGRELSPVGLPRSTRKTIRGRVEDISPGGLRIQTSQPLTVSLPIRCELPFPNTPVTVPVIVKVQWTQRISSKSHRYKSGLQFLI